MATEFGSKLRELRDRANMTADEVSKRLKEKGFSIAGKTLSGYETGIRMLNADLFMALMEIYKCQNPLSEFSFVEVDYSIPTDDEWDMIEKYRNLDAFGRETVDIVLDRETQRANQIKEKNFEKESEAPFRIINYYRKLASAGAGELVFDTPPDDKMEIRDIPKYKKVDYAISVNGDSMEPKFFDGDILLVEAAETIDIGEIGIFYVNGKCFVKKLGEKELISLNPERENIPLNEESKCVGRVIDKYE